MSLCTVTFSANAGGALSLGGAHVWYDAMHRQKIPGFSTISPTLMTALEHTPAFYDPDLILYSHCHPDHFSQPLLAAAHRLWPRAKLLLPEPFFPEQILLQGSPKMELAGLELRFVPLPHDGAQYANVANYGCILRSGDFRVLLTGDCAVASPALADFVDGQPIDLAILNFPWLTLPRGRAAIDAIHPRHLLIWHLPFQEDDRWGYRIAARRAVDKLTSVSDIRLFLAPLQEEAFD